MELVQDDEINALTHAFKKLVKLQSGKKNRLKNPKVFQGTYKQLLKDVNMFLPKGKMIAWKEEDPLVKKKQKLAMFESRVQDLGSHTYTKFCAALKILETRSKTPTEVYKMVVELFEGRGDLVRDFKKFCGDLFMDFEKDLPSALVDDATANTKATREPPRKRKLDDGRIKANRCAFKKGHVEKVLEPKAHGDLVSPTSPSNGGPTKALFKNEPCKTTFNKDFLVSPAPNNFNDFESPQSKRVVRKPLNIDRPRLNTNRPTSEELEKRFNNLWNT